MPNSINESVSLSHSSSEQQQQPRPRNAILSSRRIGILLIIGFIIFNQLVIGPASPWALLNIVSENGHGQDGQEPVNVPVNTPPVAHNNDNANNANHNNDDDDTKQEHQTHKPLNILLLYADDWSFKTLGAITPFIQTPIIDKMAQNGVLFHHNCVTTSICWVSRATLYTGQYASKHKTFMREDDAMYQEGVWNSTLFPILADHGYYNGMVGKWHHNTPPAVDETFGMFRNYWGNHIEERDGEEYHVTDLNEMDALEFLDNRPDDQPFALMVSFYATHALDGEEEQYTPQERTSHLYANQTVPIPKTATDEHFKAMPPFLQNPEQLGRSRWEERYRTPELYQEMMKKTYRMATEVDTACGVILEKLKEQNVLDETIVIFTTDNGNFHGEHGLAEKWYPYEESIRVPLVVMDPRMPKSIRNSTNDEFTLNIDLAPTLLQAANIPIPQVMQGRDFAPMYSTNSNDAGAANTSATTTSVKSSWRKEFYYEWFTFDKVLLPSGLALVRKDTKYIHWPEYDYEELFQLRTDPYEERNVFNTSLQTSKALLDEVKGRFEELKAAAEDGDKV